MNKKLFFSVLFSALALAMASCAKDKDGDIFSFSFENPTAQGKIYLEEDGLPVWHDHDSLRVNADANRSIHYTDAGVAYLSLSELSASNTYPYIAVLGPQSGCAINGDVVTGWANVASEYNFCRAETFDGTNVLKEKVYAPMMGYIPNEAAGRNFCMKNLCGILRFSLKASTSQYLRVQKINITSEGSDIAGRVTCTWNTSTNMPGTIQLSDQSGQHFNNIQVNNINCPLHSDYVTVCNIPIAPVTQACKLYITITVNDVSNLKTYTYTRTQTSNIFTIGRNELITLQTDLDTGGWTRQEYCTYQPRPAEHYFKVGNNKYIEFAPANLQYSPLNRVYRFAPHQYDFLGRANENVSSTYAGWIDLFGFHAGNNANYATDNVITDWTNNNQYHGAYIQYFFNCEDGYRTPTGTELTQVINDSRMTGSWTLAWVRARITDGSQVLANGLILFPDNFVCPTGIPSLTRNANGYTLNQLSLTEWATLEQAGCVFLPAGGYRKGQSAYEYENGIPYGARYGSCSHQGSSTSTNSDNATYLIFDKSNCNTDASNKYIGRSIRLVRDCTVASSSN